MKNKKTQWIVAGIVLLLAVLGGWYINRQVSYARNPPPNIIFILTDDLDFTLMPYMKNANKLIGKEGATFTNYFVTSSACCPSRASTIRGQYPHNTTILENSPGFKQFYRNGKNEDTLATWLKSAGYQNSLLGKYLNLYPTGASSTYIPPGWSDWHAFIFNASEQFYFAYTMNENGALVRYHKKAEDYSTDVLKNLAISFIKKSEENVWWKSPFFIYLSTYAPHGPDIPAPRHSELFKDLTYPQSPSFHEADTSDKPLIIRNLTKTGGVFSVKKANNLFVRRVQTIQAVDEMVASLVQTLKASGQLDNTYIILTSDNGFREGEHNLPSGKMLAYEEDIHVPFMIRGPGIQPGTTVTQMTANIDIASTLAELAHAQPADFVDGRSFVRLFKSQPAGDDKWRKALLIETGNLTGPTGVIAYRGVRTEKFMYLEYKDGELEFYDLVNDPYELNNLAGKLDAESRSSLHTWLEQLKACQAEGCRAAEMAVPGNIKY
ncbi:MAG: sulfatase [Anaerolineales bacterium]